MRLFDPVALLFAVAIYGVILYTFQLGERTQACIKSWRGTFCHSTIAISNFFQWQAVGFILTVYAVLAAVLAYISYLKKCIRLLKRQNRQLHEDYNNIANYYQNEIQNRDFRINNVTAEKDSALVFSLILILSYVISQIWLYMSKY